MKIRSRVNNLLAIVATFAAVLARETAVAITANRTVNKAGAGAVVVGHVFKPAAAVNGKGSIETPFKALIEIKADGAIAAGDRVSMSSADGDGNQRVKKWTVQTVTITTVVDADLVDPYVTDADLSGDSPDLIYGVCWNGGADGATVEVLVY
jgi:hypothetical protein